MSSTLSVAKWFCGLWWHKGQGRTSHPVPWLHLPARGAARLRAQSRSHNAESWTAASMLPAC